MCAYPTLLKQAVLPPAPQRSLAAPSELDSFLQLRSFSGLPLGLAPDAGPPWFLSLTSSRAVTPAVRYSTGEQQPRDINSHSRSKQPRTPSSRGLRSSSASSARIEAPPVFQGPSLLPCLGPILPPSRQSVASRRARNFRAGSRCVPVASCRSEPFRVSTGRRRSNSGPRGETNAGPSFACAWRFCNFTKFRSFQP